MAARAEQFLQIDVDWHSLKSPLIDHQLEVFKPLLQRVDPEHVDAMVSASKA